MGYDQQIEDPIQKLYNTLHSKGYYTKSLGEFKIKYSNPESINTLYSVVNRDGLYTKTKEEFSQQYFNATPVKKKVGIFASGARLQASSPATTSPLQLNGGGGEGGEVIQRGVISKSLGIDKSPEYDISDLNELLSKREKLNKSPVPEYVSKEVQGDYLGTTKKVKEKNPEYDKYKSELANINSQIEDKTIKSSKHLGLDPDIANKVIQDFPNETNLNNLRKRASLINENPIQYERISAAYQNQQKIAEVAGNHVANQYNDLNEHGGTYQGLVQNLPEQIDIINQNLTGKDRDKAIENLRISSGHNLNATVPDIQYEYEHSGLREKGVDADQYAGLLTLKYFNPQKYEQALNFINTPVVAKYKHSITGFVGGGAGAPGSGGLGASSTYENENPVGGTLTQGTISQQTQQEQTLHELLSIGRNNAKDYLIEHNNSLNRQYSEATTQEQQDAIAAKSLQNVVALKSIAQDEQQDAERFPLQHKMQLEQMAKELTQEKGENVINYFFRKLAEGADAPRKSFENLAISTFGGSKSNTELQRRRGGESIIEQQNEILPSSYGANSMQSLPVFSKDTKEAVQKIKNDKSLSSFEKKEKIQDLADDVIKNNKVDWVTNPEFGKTKNLFSLATLYGNANMLAGLAELSLETIGLKGLGAGKFLSAGLPMYVMEEQNQYKEAVSKGLSNPEEYAVANALPMFLLASGVSQLDIAKRAVGGTEAGKVLENMTEKEWANIASKNSRRISALSNSLGKALHSSSDLLLRFGVAPQVAQAFIKQGMFNDSRTVGDAIDESVKNLGNSIIDAGGLLLLTGVSNYKEVSPTLKASIWNISQHPKLSIKEIRDQVEQNQITQEVADNRIKTINKIEGLINEIPKENKIKQLLTDGQRMDLLVTKLLKDGGDKKAENEILSKKQDEVVPEKPDELKEIADQALNKVPTEGITDEMNLQAAIKTYGKDKVKEAIEASLPLELKKNEDELAAIENPKQGDIDFHNDQAQEIKSKHEAALKAVEPQDKATAPTPKGNTSNVGVEEKIKLPKGAKEVFHYSENESLNKLEDREGGTWFTDNGYGYQRRPGVKGKVSKVIEPDNLNLATEKQVWAAGEGDWANGVKKIKEQGFDGIKQTVDGDKHYLVFDLKNVKDKSDYTTKEQSLKAEDKAPVTKPEGKSDVVDKASNVGGDEVLNNEVSKKYFSDEAFKKAKEQEANDEGVLVMMPIDDFLAVNPIHSNKQKAETVKGLSDKGDKFNEIPFLTYTHTGNGMAVVSGHEGRHRAALLKEKGEKYMPVLMKNVYQNENMGSEYVTKKSISDINSFNEDTGDKFPDKLHGASDGRKNTVPFPITREGKSKISTSDEKGAAKETKPSTAAPANTTEQSQSKQESGGKAPVTKPEGKSDVVDKASNVGGDVRWFGSKNEPLQDWMDISEVKNPNIIHAEKIRIQDGMGLLKEDKEGNVYTTKQPANWDYQLSYEKGKNVPSNIYIAFVKNPSTEGSEYGHETASPSNEVSILKYLGSLDDFRVGGKDSLLDNGQLDAIRIEYAKEHGIKEQNIEFHLSTKDNLLNEKTTKQQSNSADVSGVTQIDNKKSPVILSETKISKILENENKNSKTVGQTDKQSIQFDNGNDFKNSLRKLQKTFPNKKIIVDNENGYYTSISDLGDIGYKDIVKAHHDAQKEGYDGIAIVKKTELKKAVDQSLSKQESGGKAPVTKPNEKVAELEKERDAKITKEGKPEVKMEFVTAKELVDSKDPIGNKKIHTDIKDRYKKMRELLDCLWA